MSSILKKLFKHKTYYLVAKKRDGTLEMKTETTWGKWHPNKVKAFVKSLNQSFPEWEHTLEIQ